MNRVAGTRVMSLKMDYLTDCIETLRRRVQKAKAERAAFVAKGAWSAEDEAEVNGIDEFLEWAEAEMVHLQEALWAKVAAEDGAECPRVN